MPEGLWDWFCGTKSRRINKCSIITDQKVRSPFVRFWSLELTTCTGNEELILGYGFSIEQNPDDSLALKLGIPPSTLTPKVRDRLSRLEPCGPSPVDKTFYIPRTGILPRYLLDVVRIVLSAEYGERDRDEDPEVEMQMTALLLEMIGKKHGRLEEIHARNEGIVEGGEVRTAVWDMVQDYVQGEFRVLDLERSADG
jgi:hypothetical protein